MLAVVGVRSGKRVWPDHEGYGVPSPGGWDAPAGTMPGWNWTPPGGLRPRLERIPSWARVWYRVPFVDRFAHVWMWDHGGWDVDPPEHGSPDALGVREPLRPRPTPVVGTAQGLPEPQGR
jgi:hypothetical protein